MLAPLKRKLAGGVESEGPWGPPVKPGLESTGRPSLEGRSGAVAYFLHLVFLSALLLWGSFK